MTVTEPDTGAPALPLVNEVRLVGRISGEVTEVALPSGDTLATFRLVVPRPPAAGRSAAPGRRAPSVDTIDCVARPAALRRRLPRLVPAPAVAVTGALRRRFYRGPGGPASRYEVEVASIAAVG